MGITAKNITQHEIIGLETEISKAANKSLQGIKGKITDETQNTITVRSGNKKKVLLKDQIALTFRIDNQTIEVDGKSLMGRPEERVKK